MTYLEKKINELGREFVDNEYQNMPVKVFCEKYQVCYVTCIKIMGFKERGHYQKRGQASYKKAENERGLKTDKWEYKKHEYEIIGEFREIGWMKGLNLLKNTTSPIQH